MILRSLLFWFAFLAILAVGAIGCGISSWLAVSRFAATFEERRATELESYARFLMPRLRPLARSGDEDAIAELCSELGRSLGARVTWIDPSGRVLGESEVDPTRLDDHSNRPEVILARSGKRGVARRYSDSLGEDYLYVAVPIEANGTSGAGRSVFRMSVTARTLERPVAEFRSRVLAALYPVLLAALLVAAGISWPAVVFLRRLREGALRVARFDLQSPVPVPMIREAGETAHAFNRMTARIEERLRRMEVDRRDSETLLASMGEGVIAVDGDERVVIMNRAGGELLGLDPKASIGRTLPERIRNPDLLRLVRRALAAPGAVDGSVRIVGPEERYLAASGSSWIDPDRGEIGALLVLKDMTRLERLEGLRREFVANVSHELRTPITSIRGFAETLRDTDDLSEDEARRFYEILAREAARLHAMLEDLLVLARVEKETDDGEGIRTDETAILRVLAAAAQATRSRAERKSVRVEVECPEDLRAQAHPTLLEQAVQNLVDNAIRYSEPGQTIRVAAEERGGRVVVSVTDEGAGIAKDHLPRLFERFYRVDSSRSRKDGGTGLGLAIVKHIAQAHGGYVTVDSELGEGSRFEVWLGTPRGS